MPQIRDKRSRTTLGENDGWPHCVNSRAEKSRHAAKMRRDKESEEITALSKLLPYPEEVTARLDKGSVIRLATSFLQMKKYTKRESDSLLKELETTAPNEELASKDLIVSEISDGHLMLQAWNGFLIFISRKGQIYYISENASKHLGIHQYEMLGKSVLDFIHPEDHKELAKQFMVSVPGQQTFKGYGMEGTKDRPTAMRVNFFNQTDEKYISVTDFIQERSFFLRMKSVMAKKSSSGKGKVVGYRRAIDVLFSVSRKRLIPMGIVLWIPNCLHISGLRTCEHACDFPRAWYKRLDTCGILNVCMDNKGCV